MKIIFLGTSHGVPAADRYCSCTALEINGDLYLIDAGAPATDLLLRQGLNPEKVKAIFTTHAHGDHVNGILSFADLANWYYKNTSVDIYMTEQAPIDGIISLVKACESGEFHSDRIRFSVVDQDFVYQDENLRVSLIPTKHMAGQGRPTYAILVESGGKTALFTGDMSGKLERGDFPKIAAERELDLVVSEMAHFGPDHVRPYLDTCKAKDVRFTHVFPLEKMDGIRAMDGVYPFPVTILNDGDVVEL